MLAFEDAGYPASPTHTFPNNLCFAVPFPHLPEGTDHPALQNHNRIQHREHLSTSLRETVLRAVVAPSSVVVNEINAESPFRRAVEQHAFVGSRGQVA